MKTRSFLAIVVVAALMSALTACKTADTASSAAHGSPAASASVSPADALARVKAGNERFVAGKAQHPNQSTSRRTELAGGQKPFVIVLACADSRTAPELVFDQGLGDVFVVRVAGNVVTTEGLGSIEYGVEVLGSRLIVVLGHESCGAVDASKKAIASKSTAPGHIHSLVEALRPVCEANAAADVETTSKANEQRVAESLRQSTPLLKKRVDAGELVVVPAHYHLGTGVVEFLPDAKK